jgi:hypothetical protein
MSGGDHGKRDLWGGNGAGSERDVGGTGRGHGELIVAGDRYGE